MDAMNGETDQTSANDLPIGCAATLGVLAGAIGLPVIIFLILLLVTGLDPSCRGGGMNGGCAIGVFAATISATVPGALIGLAFGLWRSISRRRRARQARGTSTASPDANANNG